MMREEIQEVQEPKELASSDQILDWTRSLFEEFTRDRMEPRHSLGVRMGITAALKILLHTDTGVQILRAMVELLPTPSSDKTNSGHALDDTLSRS